MENKTPIVLPYSSKTIIYTHSLCWYPVKTSKSARLLYILTSLLRFSDKDSLLSPTEEGVNL